MSRNEAPKFLAPIKSVIIDEGKSATFQAVVSGKPSPKVNWFKDDTLLKASRDFDISFRNNRAILKITKVGAKHVGTYKCEISNDSGKAECTSQLKVKGLGSKPGGGTPANDDGATKDDDATGVPAETGDNTADGKTTPSGEAAASGDGAANKAPQFTKKLESHITSEGNAVIFEVAVDGVPTPTVQWFHNGDTLSHSVDIQIPAHIGNAHKLIIPEVFDDDAGSYEVKAENSVGAATCTATLVVNPAEEEKKAALEAKPTEQKPPPPPPQEEKVEKVEEQKTKSAPPPPKQIPPSFTKSLSNIKVKEGSSAKFECIIKGEPQPEVTWFREDVEIIPSPDFELTYQDGKCSLNVPEVFVDDSGTFKVTATNAAGSKSTSCQLKVEAAPPPPQPKQEPPPKPAPVKPPQPKEEPKQAVPPPPPEQPKKKPTKIMPPEFVKYLEPAKFVEGMSCKFSVQVKGEPMPEVAWLLNGAPIASGYRFICKYDSASGRASLDITMLLDNDLGTYTCVAKSKAGQISCQAPLMLEDEYKVYAKEKALEDEMQQAKSKREDINRQLSNAFDKEGGKLVPSQRGQGGDPVYYNPDEGPIMTPFEKRLLREAEAREAHLEKDQKRPRLQQGPEDFIVSQFEERLQREINQRGGDTADIGRHVFDVAAFEAELLNVPKEGTTAHPDTETEVESEMDTDTEGMRSPKFTKELKNIRIAEGGSVQLSCRVEGLPKPQLRWFKDGKPLTRSTRHDLRYVEGFCSLKIQLILAEDQGAYTVLADSPAGRAISTGRLIVDEAGSRAEIPQHMKGVMAARVHMEGEAYSVPERQRYGGDVTEKHYKPKFKEIPTDMNLKEGKMARFDLRVTGRPPPDLVWYRNEQQLYNDNNHRMLVNEGGNQSLIIPYVRPVDAGTYTCKATNRAGESHFSVQLVIEAKADMVAPSFIDRIENLVVNEGEEIVLVSKVTGIPKPQVNWQKDGHHLKPGHPTYRFEVDNGTCKLVIDQASRRDGGWYTCIAFNKAGRVACRCKIQVIADRTKRFQPTPPPESVRTVKSTDTMTRIQLERETVPSYVIPGTYSDDEDYPRPAIQPPEFLIPLNDMLGKSEGDEAHFACRLKNAKDSSMKIDWYLNDRPLFIGSRVQTTCEFGICTLDIRGLYPEDSGVIKCIARNASGVCESSGRLVCKGKASLVLESQLPPEMRGIEKTLQFEEDLLRGNFELETKDTFPEEEAAPPEFLKVPEPVCISEGEPARFSCRITGYPLPKIMWYKDNSMLISTSRMKVSFDGIHQLDIPKTRFYDSGTIKIVARNKHGEAEFETSLDVRRRGDDGPVLKHTKTVAEPPKPATDAPTFVYFPPKETKVEIGDPLKLSAQIIGNPSPRVSWFKDNHPLQPDNRIKMLQNNDNYTLLIVEALHEDTGSYEIEAVNASGTARQTFTIDVKGGTSLPKKPTRGTDMQKILGPGTHPVFEHGLTDIEVPEGCPVELACQVIANPPPEIVWYYNGGVIKPSRYFQMAFEADIASLLINEVFPEDAGTYTCEAVNDHGSAVTHSNLKVQGALDESDDL